MIVARIDDPDRPLVPCRQRRAIHRQRCQHVIAVKIADRNVEDIVVQRPCPHALALGSGQGQKVAHQHAIETGAPITDAGRGGIAMLRQRRQIGASDVDPSIRDGSGQGQQNLLRAGGSAPDGQDHDQPQNGMTHRPHPSSLT